MAEPMSQWSPVLETGTMYIMEHLPLSHFGVSQ